jgi:hypothetical protein
MMISDFFGVPSQENLQFCLKDGFDKRSQVAVKPFYTHMSLFGDSLLNMTAGINSTRMTFATIVGSTNKVFSEFSNRITQLFLSVRLSAARLNFLMKRVFATAYAIIFMGTAGISAVANFSNTFLFKFLETFCFDPATPVLLQGKGSVPISSVQIGDRFLDGSRVTALFQFAADGQPMVFLDSILVSTNHYVLYKSSWIQAKDHPSAIPTSPWSGGTTRPLICLNTDTHSFPIDSYIFRDYDETEEGDQQTMAWIDSHLNSTPLTLSPDSVDYSMACHPTTQIVLEDKTMRPANTIQLGQPLSHGTVVGIIQKEVHESCLVEGERFASGTMVWNSSMNRWVRAYTMSKKEQHPPIPFYSFVVTPSACIETKGGILFRDYVEIHSPDAEDAYTTALSQLQSSLKPSNSSNTL